RRGRLPDRRRGRGHFGRGRLSLVAESRSRSCSPTSATPRVAFLSLEFQRTQEGGSNDQRTRGGSSETMGLAHGRRGSDGLIRPPTIPTIELVGWNARWSN